nr:leucyl/phenylalanyl-tRNA--protein transferase [Brevibacterium sp. XM4083]
MRYGADVDTGVRTIAVNDPDPYSVAWLNPDPRPVIDLTSRGAGRSMRRLARRHGQWRTTIDVAFDDVVTRCAQHRGSSWITSALRKSLRNLHDAGVAHSCEVWDDDQLIGGVFGLRLGAVFTADSQFTAVEGAGKLAVVDLMTRFAQSGGTLLDLQHDTPHARTLGATAMPRSSYLTALQRLNTQRTIISSEARSAKHIAELNTA